MHSRLFLRFKPVIIPALLVLSSGTAMSQAGPGGASGAAAGPSKVGVITVAEEAVPFKLTSPGRAVAYEQAFIRPRVEGVVEEIPYEPGRKVEKDDVLFRLESDTYEAILAAAQADVERAQAAVKSADTTYKRYQTLLNSGITREELENAAVAQLQTKADLSAARATLKVAELNLSRTQIRSPIVGIVDVPDVSIGAIVTANQNDALTTVTRLDPIYVDAAESSARMGRIRERINNGTLSRGEKLSVELTLENGEVYSLQGALVSPGVLVSTSTGTVNFRFQFDNPDRLILPGQFVRAEVTLGTTNAILVPQRATSRGANGDLTAFVAREGQAKKVTLTTSGSHNNAWIVTDGINAGDQLIVDGLRTLKADAPVIPVPATIDEDGVVHDITPSDVKAQ